MHAATIIFYCLAATIIGGALMAVTSLKIFRAAVFLLFSLLGIAGLYFWLNYEFIAAEQIVVYVGGIVVLVLYICCCCCYFYSSSNYSWSNNSELLWRLAI